MKRQILKFSPVGHTVVKEWDTDTVTEDQMKEIESEFKGMMLKGYAAANITNGVDEITREFKPENDYLMLPKFQGGCS